MRIASWNVNSIKVRLEHVLKWLEENGPDVLLLQELKGTDFPEDVLKDAGYHAAVVPQKARHGVAALCKEEPEIIAKKLPGDDTDEEARFIDIKIRNTRIIGIYAPNGNPVDTDKYTYKHRWMDRLKDYLQDMKAKNIPYVIGGDFNVIPENEDCYNPAAWEGDALFTLETRQKYRALLNLGLTDAFRVWNQQSEHYTFWDYQNGAWPANRGIRIDHFLLSPAMADRLQSCHIDKNPRDWERPSDHTPIVIDLGY